MENFAHAEIQEHFLWRVDFVLTRVSEAIPGGRKRFRYVVPISLKYLFKSPDWEA